MQKSPSVDNPLDRARILNSIRIVIAIVVIAVVAIIVNVRILRDGIIFETPDLHIHLKWLQHFYQHLSEGVWYPRWLAGLNYGYGSPTFVFYPPAVSYLGSALKAVGLSTERAVATIIVLSSFTAGIGFYFFGSLRWRSVSATLGAIAYMAAPYLIFNTYHRGALAEVLATSLLPLGLLLTDRLLKFNQGWGILTLFFALLSLTHLPSLLLYSLAWTVYILAQRLPIKRLFSVGMSPVIGFGLSSFYLVPAVLEKKLVNLDSMRGVTGGFAAHLIPLGGEGGRLSGHIISMFRYGLASAIICLTIATILGTSKSVWLKRSLLWFLSLCVLGCLMTSLSYGLWAASPTLQMVQFPWRLMGLFSLIYASAFSLAVESLYTLLNKSRRQLWKVLIAAGLLICLLGWNLKYTHVLSIRYAGFYSPGDLTQARADNRWAARSFDYVSLALNDPYSNQLKDVQEYLPLHPDKQTPVNLPIKDQPRVTVATGQAAVTIDQWQGYQRQLSVTVTEPAELHFRTYYYPAWHAYVNNIETPVQLTDDGLIGLTLAPGNYTVQLRYQSTAAMQVGTVISLISLACLGGLRLRTLKRRSFKNV